MKNSSKMSGKWMRFALTSAAALAWMACSDSSSSSKPEANFDEVETREDLSICSKNFDGDSVFIKKESRFYLCKNGSWNITIRHVDETKNLDSCDAASLGDSVFVESEARRYRCEESGWKKLRKEVPSIYALEKCGKENQGEIVWVTQEKEDYVCADDWEKVSAKSSSSRGDNNSSAKESSSSVSSSSEMSSSSAAISSSSAAVPKVESADKLAVCNATKNRFIVFVEDENALYMCNGSSWGKLSD